MDDFLFVVGLSLGAYLVGSYLLMANTEEQTDKVKLFNNCKMHVWLHDENNEMFCDICRIKPANFYERNENQE